MTRLLRAIGHPATQLMIGILAIVAFLAPLSYSTRPTRTMLFVYGAWAAVVVLLGLASLGRSDEDGA